MRLTCSFCQVEFDGYSKQEKWGRAFCSRSHYDQWRAAKSPQLPGERGREYTAYKRHIWGGSGRGANDVGPWARKLGRQYEVMARDRFLGPLGFSEVVDCSEMSTGFFVDFIATYQAQRVLVDVTIKMDARAEHKIPMARALGMRLFYIHIPPAHPEEYYFHEIDVANRTTVKVPLRHIHGMYSRLGVTFEKPADSTLYNRSTTVVAKPCAYCGQTMLQNAGRQHIRYCSLSCRGKANGKGKGPTSKWANLKIATKEGK